MQYYIQEGVFDLPIALKEDQTINILQLDEEGLSLVISRSDLKADETFNASFNRQIKQLEKSMKGFLIKDRKNIKIGGEQSAAGIECYNQFETDKHFICQYQFAAQVENKMLVFSYAKHIELGLAQEQPELKKLNQAHWDHIKKSFVLNKLSERNG